mmetsp:Transcript_7846/g.11972  ORF Transcript_7846/g.11972 Transcript_7846/m.11972 type:complete len:121 (+) Transcript_7846:1030-1392(+)
MRRIGRRIDEPPSVRASFLSVLEHLFGIAPDPAAVQELIQTQLIKMSCVITRVGEALDVVARITNYRDVLATVDTLKPAHSFQKLPLPLMQWELLARAPLNEQADELAQIVEEARITHSK